MYLALLVCIFGNTPAHELRLSSADYSALLYENWLAKAAELKDGFIIHLAGDKNTGEGMTLIRITDSGSETILTTTPREGIVNVANLTVDPQGKHIYMLPYVQTFCFHYDIEAKKFSRYSKSNWEDTLFMYQDNVFLVKTNPQPRITPALEQPTNPFAAIVEQIPQVKHALDGHTNLKQHIVHVHQDSFYIGYSTHHEVFEFDIKTSELIRTIPMVRLFPGFNMLPELEEVKRVKGNDVYYANYMEKGYVLNQLATHQGELFGMFRKSYTEDQVWASLETRDRFFPDDLPADQPQVLYIGEQHVLLGTQQERDSGDIEWTVWLSSSLPSSP